MKIKIIIVVGTRPEIIKLALLIKLISKDSSFSLTFVHSGQHYDENLSSNLFKDLELPEPDVNIGIGSGNHGYQTATLLKHIEKLILSKEPDLVIAQGDTNTVLATSLATRKQNKVFMHLEAGIRSFDKRMPEEINRIITGVCSNFHLAPTKRAATNLLFENIPRDSIFIVGNTIVDSVMQVQDIAIKKSNIFQELKIKKDLPIVLGTLHRPSNVDNKKKLQSFIEKIIELKQYRFIFPIHPRTKKNMESYGLIDIIKKESHILITDPLSYLDFFKGK
jgi:UDP-N-acetylglucosamine 2-epimerase (non-hydrolysing)